MTQLGETVFFSLAMHSNSTVEETSSVYLILLQLWSSCILCVSSILGVVSVALIISKLVLLQVVNYMQKLFMCMVIQDDSNLLSFPFVGCGKLTLYFPCLLSEYQKASGTLLSSHGLFSPSMLLLVLDISHIRKERHIMFLIKYL
jgi:hypothetical protein